VKTFLTSSPPGEGLRSIEEDVMNRINLSLFKPQKKKVVSVMVETWRAVEQNFCIFDALVT
jgi:hypothetical protein